ncbi:glycoside hydrolase family 13 protein [Pseudomassariella vexata]|uniref:alpha-amylase n=1 Tax=Pseudomassariella vexata TaxID=1141098 RepID=A0A1Y2DEB6_9PEZI|nr:glycoside hydrolase family 13 protein [Pseudomassariella vexata]ORY57547.1 glycoside hydrolase family 13 protein [Pseudomassariella vexata]
MKLGQLLPALCAATCHALSTAEWQQQSIYQVVTDRFARTDGSTTASCETTTYCGGTWKGITNALDYIQSMGFTAVWISPIVKNIEGDTGYGYAYHGYWAQDIWSLNSNFGTEQDLVDLSSALHKRGMYLMLDIVTNHLGYNGCSTCVDYSIFNPFSSSSYFHPYCAINYSDENSVRNCWQGDNIVSLPDLRTEDDAVRDIWNDWIKKIVSKYYADGLRIDSMKHIEYDFFPDFEGASGVFNLGEVYEGNPNNIYPWLNYTSGVLNYPAYYWITRAFQSTSATMTELVDGINDIKASIKTSTLGSFLENHDQVRFPHWTNDMALAKNAIAFTMLMDGIPIIYQGQEQHFSGGEIPANREALWTSGYSKTAELYIWITKVNSMRAQAIAKDNSYTTYQADPIYSDSHTIVLRKGSTGSQVVSVFTNIGASGSSYTVSLSASATGFTASQSLVEVMSCAAYTTDSSGDLNFQMGSTAKIFYLSAKLDGSKICDTVTDPGTTTTGPTQTTTMETTTRTSTTGTACATSTAVAVTFEELASTSYGETIELVGNITALGNWDSSNAVALSATQYTDSHPLWTKTINFSPGTAIQYKYVKVDGSGSVSWEDDPNHTYTVPGVCETATTVSDTWQS